MTKFTYGKYVVICLFCIDFNILSAKRGWKGIFSARMPHEISILPARLYRRPASLQRRAAGMYGLAAGT